MKPQSKSTLMVAAALVIFTCCSSPTVSEENATLAARDAAVQEIHLPDEDPNAKYLEVLEEIDQSLDLIRQKQGVVFSNQDLSAELQEDKREKILRDIHLINSMMDDSDKKIKKLQANLEKSRLEKSQLMKLSEDISKKYAELENSSNELKAMLVEKNFSIAELNSRLELLSQENETLKQEAENLYTGLYTAYYIVGNSKTLEQKGVVGKSRLLGMVKSKKINSSADMGTFKGINLLNETTIPVNSKKARLITPHPKDSYEFERENNVISYIKITDPDEFWQMSRYLVVETK